MADHDGDGEFSSHPSFRLRWDAFLSFRGEDTRHTFTERLYRELTPNGVRTFRDDEELERGEEIAPGLVEAIEDSTAAIAVISRNYASSRWCLEELARIVEFRKLLLPVFYEVDPSDVRRQTGPFKDHFAILAERFGEKEVQRWRRAMETAGSISGWDSRIWNEQKLIESLVKRVLRKMSKTPLDVAKYPVGLESRLQELMSKLDVKGNGVRVLGLYGMGGAGKTILAKALYNKLVVYFKRRCFIFNVKETWKENNGLVDLQKKLIDGLSSSVGDRAQDSSTNMRRIREVVHEEPVVIVLDDVDDVRQLDALAIKKNWFYEGSRIVITTRDKNVLDEGFVNALYEVKDLNSSESKQLFSYHAFGREKPPKGFVSVSERIVSLTGGLPLALEVFGSFMFDKRRTEDWEAALQKLKNIRPGHLQDVLQISFNGLDDQERCAFLDIACFFVKMRMRREDVIDILEGCGISAEIVMTVLTTKSLIKIVEDNVLWMHDQIRDMGRQIVVQENLEDPGQRSRLWVYDDVLSVLKYEKGTRNIQGIALDIGKSIYELSPEQVCWINFKSRPSIKSAVTYLREVYNNCFRGGVDKEKDVVLRTNSLEPIKNLRLLQINHVKLNGSFQLMPTELKWLQWKGCPLRSLPSEFDWENISVLDLSESSITEVWDCRWWHWSFWKKNPKRLRVMNLRNCWKLTEIPDLSAHHVLEKLILENCVRLIKIHNSIGDLSTLLYLNLENCSKLLEFPSNVSGLKHLKILILSGCTKLTALPEDIGSMKSLRELLLNSTAIDKLPDSIFRLKKLERLSLKDCRSFKQLPNSIGRLNSLKELSLDGSGLEELPDSIGSLESLMELNLRHCISLTEIPHSTGNLTSLVELHLSGSGVKELPASIGSLSHLQLLSVHKCRFLTSLPDSIGGLVSLVNLELGRTSIKNVPDQIDALRLVKRLDMANCSELVCLPEVIRNMLSITSLSLDNTKITELPEGVGMLEKLNMLKLNYCKHLQQLPSSIGNLKSLRRFEMAETPVIDLPNEFGMLSNLTVLKMRKDPQSTDSNTQGISHKLVALPESFSKLTSLEELDLYGWKLSGKIPDEFGRLISLETLNLSHNDFCSLPSSLTGLSLLKDLVLSHCRELKSLPPLPSGLLKLSAASCSSLESISDLSNLKSLLEMNFTSCSKITDVPGLECLSSLRRLYMSDCSACIPAVKRRLAKVALRNLRCLSIPGSEIPDWFVQEIPSFASRRNLAVKGIIIGVVVSLDQSKPFPKSVPVNQAIVDVQAKIVRQDVPIFTTALYLMGVPETDEDQLHLCRYLDFTPLVLLLKDGDKIQIGRREPPYFRGLELKKYGIHLIYENDDDLEDNKDELLLDESQQSVSMKLARFIGSL